MISWEPARLGWHVDTIVPQRDKPKDLTGEIPWLRIEDFEGKYISTSRSGQGVTTELVTSMPLRVFPKGSVVTSCSCTMGATAIAANDLITNQTFIGLVPVSGKINSDFLYYLMLEKAGHLQTLASGAIQQYLSQDDFRRLSFRLPPLSTQRAIADYLDRETAEIDAMAAELDELMERLQSRKNEMVDHLLFASSSDHRYTRQNAAERGIDWIPPIPQSWSIRPAWCVFGERKERADVAETHLTPSQKFGVLPQSEYIERSGARVVLNLKGGDSMKLVMPGDFVIHLRSFQGGIERSDYRGKVSVAYTILSPSSVVTGTYFNHLMKTPRFIHALAAMTDQLRDGQVISFARFSQLSLPCPPHEVQCRIGNEISELSERLDAMIADARELKALLAERRSALITEVVTGRKEVLVS